MVVHCEDIGRTHSASAAGVTGCNPDLNVGIIRIGNVGSAGPNVCVRRAAGARSQAAGTIATRSLCRRVPVRATVRAELHLDAACVRFRVRQYVTDCHVAALGA